MENKKELVVSAIENGTVIDHIPTSAVFQIIRILGLDKHTDEVLVGNNLCSEKLGRKGIIKVKNKYFESADLNKIALVAPFASLIVIKNYEVVEKITASVPDEVTGFVKCMNPMCITNHEKIVSKFNVVDKENLKLRCHYCEKLTTKDTMHFTE